MNGDIDLQPKSRTTAGVSELLKVAGGLILWFQSRFSPARRLCRKTGYLSGIGENRHQGGATLGATAPTASDPCNDATSTPQLAELMGESRVTAGF